MTSSTPDAIGAAAAAVADALAGRTVDLVLLRSTFVRAEDDLDTAARDLEQDLGRPGEADFCRRMANLARRLESVARHLEEGDPLGAASALRKEVARVQSDR